MHILLVADGRSPIAKRWAQGLVALQHEVTFVSTYPCADIPNVEGPAFLPVAFGMYGGSQVGDGSGAAQPSGARKLLGQFRSAVVSARYLAGPATLPYYGQQLRRLVEVLKPDLVHALRIPFEGMLAAYTPPGTPLVISIWGNDLTLHACRNGSMRRQTERTLRRADGLVADAQRDIRLGKEWGFPTDRPALVVPGSGGIDLAELSQARVTVEDDLETVPAEVPLVINPRGFRPGSVRNEVFFQSIPLILSQKPETVFLCPGMAGQAEALGWLRRLKLDPRQVRLLPYLSQQQLWRLFSQAQVNVSVSAHDGTPNSLLEAMACGCFPVAGDIESLREWIIPGVNGLLVDPDQPQALAEAVLLALDRAMLRASAAEINHRIILSRAEISVVREQIGGFYQQVVMGKSVETPVGENTAA